MRVFFAACTGAVFTTTCAASCKGGRSLARRRAPGIFLNASCGTALIDRVIPHADVIAIEGQSYRRRAAEENASSRRAARARK